MSSIPHWRLILTDWRVVLGVSSALLVAHLVWAYASRNGADLARCGALWAVLSGLLIARPVLRVGYKPWYIASRTYGGEPFKPSPADLERYRQTDIDARSVQIYGPLLLVAGTVLWGYGDLVGVWLFPALPT